MEVVVTLPDNIIEDMQSFGRATKRDVSTVLSETLEMMWPAWGTILNRKEYPPVESLPDKEVLRLAHAKMALAENERLGVLQEKGKRGTLSTSEQFELLILIHQYQLDLLRKSEGLAEAVHRGLQDPLPS